MLRIVKVDQRQTEKQIDLLSTLPSLLGTNQSDYPRQLSTLVVLLLLNFVLDVLTCRDLLADREHTVLQCQQFRECVVEEGCGEGNLSTGRSIGDAHFKLPWRLLDLWCW